jgi:hypothetical protein
MSLFLAVIIRAGGNPVVAVCGIYSRLGVLLDAGIR